MKEWQVTDLGYRLLENSGLDKRIDEKWKKITPELIRMGSSVDQWDIDSALRRGPAERRENARRAVGGKSWFEVDADDLMIVSGKATDIVLKRKEQDPKQFGLPNIAQFDGLIAAYMIAKHRDTPLFSKGQYNWRSKGASTTIYGDTHGDLQVRQVSTAPTFEGQLFGKLPSNHINASYDYWPIQVGTAIKAADMLGVEIPEVKSWRDFLLSYNWDGSIKSPTSFEGEGYERFARDFVQDTIAQLPEVTDTRKVKKMFMGKMMPNSNQDVIYLPVLDENGDFVYYSNCGEGREIEFKIPYPVKLKPMVHVTKPDLRHLFKGTVNGIMTTQSRTRPEYLAHVLWQYDQLKAGKSVEDIRNASYDLEG
jgi:hypothetical protein